jgi:hypothetical protein
MPNGGRVMGEGTRGRALTLLVTVVLAWLTGHWVADRKHARAERRARQASGAANQVVRSGVLAGAQETGWVVRHGRATTLCLFGGTPPAAEVGQSVSVEGVLLGGSSSEEGPLWVMTGCRIYAED